MEIAKLVWQKLGRIKFDKSYAQLDFESESRARQKNRSGR